MEEENKNEIVDTSVNEIVEIEENEEVNNTQYDMQEVTDNKKKKKKDKKPSKWGKLPKKQKIIIIVVICVVLVIIIGLLLYFLVFKKNKDNPKEPEVVVINDNYRYEDGKLIFLSEDKKELGTYKCNNKDQELCYVAYYSNEDEFDVAEKIYEDGNKIDIRSEIIDNNYVFIYDNTKKNGGEILLYNIKDAEDNGKYSLVKKISEEEVIVSKNDSYGTLKLNKGSIENGLDIKYDYIGYIEDTDYLVISNNNNYQLVDFDGKEVSKSIPGEIKNFDNNNISVKIGNDYYVYDYEGKQVLKDTFSYIRFEGNYIIALNVLKLTVYDKDGYPMTGEGVKISSTEYNTKYIFNEELRQVDKEEAFNTYLNGSILKIEYDGESTNINLNEGNYNKGQEYINYFNGKLYFYADAEKSELLGTYACSYANSLTSGSTSLENCYLAQESNILHPSEKLDNSYLPIYNKRYVFIADTKSPNGNDNIILWDLKSNKKMATYKAVDAGFHDATEEHAFITTAGNLVIAKNTSDSYGMINITSSSVDGIIPFKDKDSSALHTSISLLNNYYLIKLNDNTYHLYDQKGNKITENITISNEIVEYNYSYIKVKDSNNNYSLYNLNGKLEASNAKYIAIDKTFFISVDNNNVLGVYKYGTNVNLIEDTVYADVTKGISPYFNGKSLDITYTYNDQSNTISIDIG